MIVRFVNIDSVVDAYLTQTGFEGQVDRAMLKGLANDVINEIITDEQWQHKIKLLCVDDYTVELPEELHKIIQIAYRDTRPEKIRRYEVVEWIQQSYDGSGCEIKMSLECPRCHEPECSCDSPEVIIDVDRLWDMAHPEYKYGHMKWLTKYGGLDHQGIPISKYNREFRIMRHSQHNFFSPDSHIKGCLNLNEKLCAACPVEYVVENNKILRTNIKDADILISYVAKPTDANGDLMVPNIPAAFDAVKYYLEEVMANRASYKAKDLAMKRFELQRSQLARQNKLEAIGRARQELQIPEFGNWLSFLEQNYNKMSPYNDFFNQMNRTRSDRALDDMDSIHRHRLRNRY